MIAQTELRSLTSFSPGVLSCSLLVAETICNDPRLGFSFPDHGFLSARASSFTELFVVTSQLPSIRPICVDPCLCFSFRRLRYFTVGLFVVYQAISLLLDFFFYETSCCKIKSGLALYKDTCGGSRRISDYSQLDFVLHQARCNGPCLRFSSMRSLVVLCPFPSYRL